MHAKDNIVAVEWSAPYESPTIVEREPIEGLLDVSKSDPV